MNTQSSRYYLIDAIRGIAIISMVIFHFSYDVFILYGKNPNWYDSPIISIWQQSICWTYILIAGLVWRFGQKSSLKRGGLLILCSLLISLVTFIAMPSAAVWFGILSFLGCAVILMIPLHTFAKKAPPVAGIFVSFLFFLLFRNVTEGYVGIATLEQVSLPPFLYTVKFLTPLGFPYPSFSSSDYFPILPWFFLFLTGYFFAPILISNNRLNRFCTYKVPFLSVIGQKSLFIYLLHQPVSLIICYLFIA